MQSIVGGSGARLAVRRRGPAGAPALVLLHGWAQSSAAWDQQFADPALTGSVELVAVDLRGHGASDAPADGYADSANWAADIAAVLATVEGPAVLLGWSYGGVVVADYLRHHGSAGLAGVALVGAVTELGRRRPGGRIGPVMRAALPDALAEDPDRAVPALRAFIDGMTATPQPGEVTQRLLGAALATPPRVRAALFDRTVDSTEVFAALDVPALIVHGSADQVVDPAAGEHHAATIPGAEHLVLDGVGHLPFAEAASTVDIALAAFLARCAAPAAGVSA